MAKIKLYLFPLLILFHVIGVGLFLYFKVAPELSFLNILMSAIVVFLVEKDLKKAAIGFSVIFIIGFIIELIGVQTGYLFGEYIYASSMGPQLFGTPIIIGATWYAVIAGAANIANFVQGSTIAKGIVAGVLAVLMDVLIEQVAIGYNLWQWKSGSIPLYNYVCWFIFGSIFAYLYLRITPEKNKLAIQLFCIWIGFFAILALF
ncbi:MAG: carotenoid biosynthesis protein [Crocinitomicaceae bacterium]